MLVKLIERTDVWFSGDARVKQHKARSSKRKKLERVLAGSELHCKAVIFD